MKSIDSQSKIKRTIIYWVIITCFFLIALYIVSGSPFSSNGVKKFNNGYGTFDMKSYDARIVHQVLGDMKEQGFTVYKQYLVCDFLFIVCIMGLKPSPLGETFRSTPYLQV